MGRDGFSPERTTFVGRGAELAALDARVAEGARIVTLAGPPGAGKTRLSRRFGRRMLDEGAFEAGCFVELAEARTAEDAIEAIASTLEIPVDRASSTDAAIDVVGAALDARGRVLVVLDNAEQIVEAVAAIVGRLVDRAPQLRVIVTSRDRLRVEGESVIEVEPLDEGDARALFLDRARAVAPSWTPDDDDRHAIDELLRRLDRLPLAIELAAGRAHVLRPAALLARLGDRLHALSTHRRDMPARQASLAAAIEASWTLLSDWERAALSQISVFAGGIDVEGAEAVLDLAAFADAPSIPDALAALVDRSLARRSRIVTRGGSSSSPSGARRGSIASPSSSATSTPRTARSAIAIRTSPRAPCSRSSRWCTGAARTRRSWRGSTISSGPRKSRPIRDRRRRSCARGPRRAGCKAR